MQAKEASNVEPSALGQSVMAAQSGLRPAGGRRAGAGEGGAGWYLPVLECQEMPICISWHLMMSPGCSPGCENWLQRE